MNTIYVIQDKLWNSFPPVLQKTIVKRLNDCYRFSRHRVKLTAQIPVQIDFTDAIVRYYDAPTWFNSYKAEIVAQLKHVMTQDKAYNYQDVINDVRTWQLSLYEKRNVTGHGMSISPITNGKGVIVKFGAVSVEKVAKLVETDTVLTIDRLRELIKDYAALSPREKKRKQRALIKLGNALGGAAAHEVMHEFGLDHAASGLRAAIPGASDLLRGQFSRKDRREIGQKVKLLKALQGNLQTVPIHSQKQSGLLEELGILLASADPSFVPTAQRSTRLNQNRRRLNVATAQTGKGGAAPKLVPKPMPSRTIAPPGWQTTRTPQANVTPKLPTIVTPTLIHPIGHPPKATAPSPPKIDYPPKVPPKPLKPLGEPALPPKPERPQIPPPLPPITWEPPVAPPPKPIGPTTPPSPPTSHTAPISHTTLPNIHTVQKGEILSRIAQQHGTTVRELSQLNPWLLSRHGRILHGVDYILPGDKIKLPDHRPPATTSALSQYARGLR